MPDTIRDIADSDIPDEQKIRILLKCPGLSQTDIRLLACRWAEKEVTYWKRYLPDDRAQQAIETTRRFLYGEATIEELSIANAATWDASRMPKTIGYDSFDIYYRNCLAIACHSARIAWKATLPQGVDAYVVASWCGSFSPCVTDLIAVIEGKVVA